MNIRGRPGYYSWQTARLFLRATNAKASAGQRLTPVALGYDARATRLTTQGTAPPAWHMNDQGVPAPDFAALAREREARNRAKAPAPVTVPSGAAQPPARPTAAQARRIGLQLGLQPPARPTAAQAFG